jgi:G3E family GTPase
VIPLILLTGFLGAGKTSLLAQLLRRRATRSASGKIAILVNELGSIGIDGELLADGITAQIELPGGCVCCAVGDDFSKAMRDLVQSQPGLEAIILETTGVAEPLPIAWALERSPLRETFRLATVITIVDALNFLPSRALSASVESQVAYADVIFMTKSELAPAAQCQEVERIARELGGRCLFYSLSLDESAKMVDNIVSDPGTASELRYDDGAMACDADCAHEHVHRSMDSHTHGISSVALPLLPIALDIEDLEDAVMMIPPEVIRVKGIALVVDRGSQYWLAFHRVGLRFSSEPLQGDGNRTPRIVALGPNVTKSMLASLTAIIPASTLEAGDEL